ncbi:MAG TPA: FtsQ-type POTRA domain-containing protein [Vicinamibacterales bacterium]|nr:FtsQ-type POTRA domain-containing protein [Vicinamibacterales bacterium]
MAVKAPADKRFKRGRVKTPRKAKRRWVALVRPLVKWTLVLAIVGYTTTRALALVTESPALRISHVTVQGNSHLTATDVRSRVRMLDGANIVRADLDAARRRLLGSPWIAEATLRRQLPATVEIAIEERQPVALARFARGGLQLIAEDGIVLGPVIAGRDDVDLPIADGLMPVPGRPLSGSGQGVGIPARVDPERAGLIGRLVESLRPEDGLLALVSEVDVTDVEDAVVLLGDDPARVHLGHEDFARRVRAYRDLAPTLLQHVAAIDSADVRYVGRVFVRPARGRPAHAGQP